MMAVIEIVKQIKKQILKNNFTNTRWLSYISSKIIVCRNSPNGGNWATPKVTPLQFIK